MPAYKKPGPTQPDTAPGKQLQLLQKLRQKGPAPAAEKPAWGEGQTEEYRPDQPAPITKSGRLKKPAGEEEFPHATLATQIVGEN
jgi:hypothetical protein